MQNKNRFTWLLSGLRWSARRQEQSAWKAEVFSNKLQITYNLIHVICNLLLNMIHYIYKTKCNWRTFYGQVIRLNS